MGTLSIDYHSFYNLTAAETGMFLHERRLYTIIKEESRKYLSEQRNLSIISEEAKKMREINSRILNEFSLADAAQFAIGVVGIVPGLGEAADLANAALYAGRGLYFSAALSAISMIPVAGDLIGKGGQISLWLAKAGGNASKVAGATNKLKGLFEKYWPKVKALFSRLKDNKYIGEYVPKMLKSVEDFIKVKADDEKAVTALSQAANLERPVEEDELKKAKAGLENAAESPADDIDVGDEDSKGQK